MSHTLRIALVDVVTRLFLSAYSSRRTTSRRVRRASSRRSSCERCGIMSDSLPPVVPNTTWAQSSAIRLTRSHSRNESDLLAESGWLSL